MQYKGAGIENSPFVHRSYPANQPDDPALVARIQMYNGQIEHMNSVRSLGELPADYASDGSNPNRKPYGATAKAAPDWFYSGLASIAGAGANLTGDIVDLAFGAPVNFIDSVVDPGAGELQFNTEPYYGYTAPPTLRGQFRDLPHALSTAATDLYNHPIFTLLQQGQYIDPNLAFGAPSGLDDAAAAYQLRRLSQAEKDTTASPGAGKIGVTEPVYWKDKQVNGKKVYQRDDLIDPNRVGPDGRTNLELMQNGEAPYGPDGKRIHLHHMTQEDNSPVAEVTQSFHDKYRSIIHIDPPTVRTRINRVKFRPVRKNYWKTRANDFLPQENR